MAKKLTSYQLERLNLNKFFTNQNISVYKISDDPYSTYDGCFKSGGTNFIIESKVRDFTSFNYDNLFLEKKKYDELVKLVESKNKFNIEVLYVNFFTKDNIYFIWNLTQLFKNMIPEWYSKLLPDDTDTGEKPQFEGNNRTYSYKLITELPSKLATYTYSF